MCLSCTCFSGLQAAPNIDPVRSERCSIFFLFPPLCLLPFGFPSSSSFPSFLFPFLGLLSFLPSLPLSCGWSFSFFPFLFLFSALFPFLSFLFPSPVLPFLSSFASFPSLSSPSLSFFLSFFLPLWPSLLFLFCPCSLSTFCPFSWVS